MELIQEVLFIESHEVNFREYAAINDYQNRGFEVVDLRTPAGARLLSLRLQVLRLNGVEIPTVSLDRYGLPDLFVYRRADWHEWAFVEVKLFPDSVRLNQLLWFGAHKMPVRLFWLVPRPVAQTFTYLQLNELIDQAADKQAIMLGGTGNG